MYIGGEFNSDLLMCERTTKYNVHVRMPYGLQVQVYTCTCTCLPYQGPGCANHPVEPRPAPDPHAQTACPPPPPPRGPVGEGVGLQRPQDTPTGRALGREYYCTPLYYSYHQTHKHTHTHTHTLNSGVLSTVVRLSFSEVANNFRSNGMKQFVCFTQNVNLHVLECPPLEVPLNYIHVHVQYMYVSKKTCHCV